MQIVKVIPRKNYSLEVTFLSGEKGLFSMTELIESKIYGCLKDENMFSHVHIDPIAGTVAWLCGLDISPTLIYKSMTPIVKEINSV